NAQAEQVRREAEARRDAVNAQATQALLGTLNAVGQIQDRNRQREIAMAQQVGQTTGRAPTSGSSQAQIAGTLGAEQRKRSDAMQRAQQQLAVAKQQADQDKWRAQEQNKFLLAQVSQAGQDRRLGAQQAFTLQHEIPLDAYRARSGRMSAQAAMMGRTSPTTNIYTADPSKMVSQERANLKMLMDLERDAAIATSGMDVQSALRDPQRAERLQRYLQAAKGAGLTTEQAIGRIAKGGAMLEQGAEAQTGGTPPAAQSAEDRLISELGF
ncbi:MAG: hypothetical protein AAFV46_00180, partial [Cyanobacteria bacterium J06635_11]